jgi:predicted nucleotidyltransferase
MTTGRAADSSQLRPSTVLASHRHAVLRLARRHRAGNVRVVGSIARRQDAAGSDVDLLVSFAHDASVFDQAELIEDLQDLLGVHVDVISDGGLNAAHESVLLDARPL